MGRLDFGVTGGDRPWLASLGGLLQQMGYRGAWANDTPGRPGLAALAGLDRGDAHRLELGVGVISLSDHVPARIAASVHESDLPLERLILGVGSGRSRSLALVRAGVTALRADLAAPRIAVAALGPRMCELGGEVADVVLLNWSVPSRIATAREWLAAAAARAGRPPPLVAGYVRVAVGRDSHRRLQAEQRRYAASPAYAALFAGQVGLAGVAAERATDVPEALAPYRDALDVCVVRGLPAEDALADWSAIAEAVAS